MTEYKVLIFLHTSTPKLCTIRFYNKKEVTHIRLNIEITELNKIVSEIPNLMKNLMKNESTHGSFTKPFKQSARVNIIKLDDLTEQDFKTLISNTNAAKNDNDRYGGSHRLVKKISRKFKKSRKTRRLRNLYTHSICFNG